MGGALTIILLNNIFIFSFIFWVLTWAGEYFYKKKNHASKKNFYECGFRSQNDVNIQINLNFSILCVFLILYDIEFTFLLPMLTSFLLASYYQYLLLNLFILLIMISLVYDWEMNALNWQY